MNAPAGSSASNARPDVAPRVRADDRGSGNYRWVRLWGWPIRATHWLAVASLIVLILTGFYIGRPYFMTSGEASEHYLMGWMRFLHFAAAGVLVACGILRVYWLFRGNRYERWRALFPFRPRDWADMWRQAWSYLTIRPEKAPHYLGHNPLQQLSYTALYAVIVVQIITGFALYGQYQPGAGWDLLTEQVRPLFGGIQVVRFVHHVLTWVIVVFVPIHVYLALRADLLEKTGTISSIISGGRFVRSDVHYVDEP